MTIIQTAASSTPTLTVNTNDEKEQWVQILTAAANYHWDMAGQFEPEIKTSDESSDMEKVAKVHRGWARAIQEATQLIRFWDAEKEEEE
jgi:hypothetical protein|tara:strand:+ start:1209 stop:1475 length:267 start_codon:yes stop_codon:yes gene_type:complete